MVVGTSVYIRDKQDKNLVTKLTGVPTPQRRQQRNTCFQIDVILSPISTHIQPKQLPFLVAQVGPGTHWLLVFSLEASWQQFWIQIFRYHWGWAGGSVLYQWD